MPIDKTETKNLDIPLLKKMRCVFANVRIVLLDEVSMVGYRIWRMIDARLRDINGNDLSFGGLHVIAFGDLFQLPPVLDQFLFDSSHDRIISALTINPWSDIFLVE